jgi:hypothetical protein
MFDNFQEWWQNALPQIQAAIPDGILVLGALLGGHVLGGMVSRSLRARNFDAALRLPDGSSAAEPEHQITPTFVAGLLIRLSVWAGAAAWLAQEHDRPDLAHNLGLILQRTWGFAAVLVAALALGSLLARRLISCLHAAGQPGFDARPTRNGTTASGNVSAAAGVAGGGVYLLMILLVLMTAADLFDWPLTRSSALALWQFTQRLLIAAAGLGLGYLGACWTRDLTLSEGVAPLEKRAGQYTALAIMGATTVLAVSVLLSNAGFLLCLAAMVVLGLLLWFIRGHLPDVTAGQQLRHRAVKEVWFDGERWQVMDVGLLTTQLSRAGEFSRLRNRRVLEARMHAAAPEPAVAR